MNLTELFGHRLTVIIEQHDDAIDALGERVRVEVIIPLCQKYKLSFVVIQGNFWFIKSKYTKKRNDWHNAPQYSDTEDLDKPFVAHGYDDISQSAKDALRPVLELLNEDIAHNNPFGHHVVPGVCIPCLKFYGMDYKGDCTCDAG